MHYGVMAKKTKYQTFRERLSLTQAQMAERLGVDQATVSRVEGGQSPSRLFIILWDKMAGELT